MENETLKLAVAEDSKKNGLDLEYATKLVALASSGLYILGFLVVTSYLATKGIFDQSLISAKYLMTGGLTALTVGIYYYFVWRKIVDRVKVGVKWPTPINPGFRIFLDSYYAVEFAYGCCFTATSICMLFAQAAQPYPIAFVLTLAFLIDTIFLNTGFYAKHRKWAFLITFALNATATMAFLVYAYKHPPLLSLAGIFLAFSITGSIVIASPSWSSSEDRNYSRFYLAICALTGVIGFGATVYPHIDARFGGQKPVQVDILLAPDAVDSIRNKILSKAPENYLVFESESVVAIQLGKSFGDGEILRFDRKLVQGMITRTSNSVSADEDIGKQMREIFSRP